MIVTNQIPGPTILGKWHLMEKSNHYHHQIPVHKRILVVDDNSDIAFTLKIGLEDSDQNMQVHSFDNPITALLVRPITHRR